MVTWLDCMRSACKDGKNHRLFCLLVRNATNLGGSSIVCLGGLSKPRRQAADPKDYKQIIEYRSESTGTEGYSNSLTRL